MSPRSVFLSILLSGPLAAADSPPNMVFILADDCTYLDMEVYGGQAKTPHLNQLATEGLKFSRCFQTAPMCSPTRHNLYTGIYPVKSGAWPNHTQVYPGTKSIAHYLSEAGYRVALSGKTHIGPKDSFPFDYSDEFRSADPDNPNGYPSIESLLKTSHETDTPFCLFACSNEPHTPYRRGDSSQYPANELRLPPSFVDTPETRIQYGKYLAEITFFDRQCGRLLDLLDQYQLRSNTLVMVASEQGSGFPFAKWTCYELGLTSGLIARWPGRISPRTETDALVEYVDVTPTLLAAAGLDTPPAMDGISFLPLLLGRTTEHKQYTFGIHTTRGIINGSPSYGIRSCGTKTFRYIRNLTPEIPFRNVVTRQGGDQADFWDSWQAQAKAGNPRAKNLVHRYQYRPPEELFDVVNDPYCLENLIDRPQYTATAKSLSEQLNQWMKAQGDQGQETERLARTRSRGYIQQHGNK